MNSSVIGVWIDMVGLDKRLRVAVVVVSVELEVDLRLRLRLNVEAFEVVLSATIIILVM